MKFQAHGLQHKAHHCLHTLQGLTHQTVITHPTDWPSFILPNIDVIFRSRQCVKDDPRNRALVVLVEDLRIQEEGSHLPNEPLQAPRKQRRVRPANVKES